MRGRGVLFSNYPDHHPDRVDIPKDHELNKTGDLALGAWHLVGEFCNMTRDFAQTLRPYREMYLGCPHWRDQAFSEFRGQNASWHD